MIATPTPKPRVLLVDDEPAVLHGLSLHLGRHYSVATATSGSLALEQLAAAPDIAVIMSDMRMPGMDGATLLARARTLAPNTVRLLLTGQSDIQSAIAAINEGQIFRFLTKPCPPPQLVSAIGAAVEQHHLLLSERVLLEQTLHGSIKAMLDVLALVSPASFGRATRLKQLAAELAEHLDLRDRWQVEVAAMLSQLGHITLPPETAERLYFGRPLSDEEQSIVDRLPDITEELLLNIPRLEAVRTILRTYPGRYNPELSGHADEKRRSVAEGASVLRMTMDYDAIESTGASPGFAVDTLRGRTGQYDPRVLQALSSIRGSREASAVRELPAGELRVGMIMAEDVAMPNGVLMVARGYEITARFLERIRNTAPGGAKPTMWRVTERPREACEVDGRSPLQSG